jgi:hypothetical protein
MASSKEIEREVEDQRAHVESTLEALRRKMSVGQMVDEVGAYVGAEDAKQAFRNVGRQVRDNPLALGLVAVGMAWLMFGGSERRDREGPAHAGEDAPRAYRGRPAYAYAGGDRGDLRSTSPGGGGRYGSAFGTPYDTGDDRGSSSEGVLSRAGGAASGAAQAVGDRLSEASERVRSAVSSASERVRDAAGEGRSRLSGLSGRGGAYMPDGEGLSARGRRAGDALADALERQPLVVGALALGAGVVIGVALPATRSEDRWLGERRDDLLDEARGTAEDLGRQTLDAARAGLRAAGEAAEEEGLAPRPEGRTLAEKVEHVVKAGVEETRRNLGAEPQTAPTTPSTDPDQPETNPRTNNP